MLFVIKYNSTNTNNLNQIEMTNSNLWKPPLLYIYVNLYIKFMGKIIILFPFRSLWYRGVTEAWELPPWKRGALARSICSPRKRTSAKLGFQSFRRVPSGSTSSLESPSRWSSPSSIWRTGALTSLLKKKMMSNHKANSGNFCLSFGRLRISVCLWDF